MSLLTHIFRKDVRHFWPEILINLVLFIAFAWAAPFGWSTGFEMQEYRIVPFFLRLLLPLGWLFLISRAVHDEALAGDRQFWITRPYPWQALLLEKFLFLVTFLNLPLFLTQLYLLHHAGLPIGPALGALLLYQLLIEAVFVLPFIALAVITASFGRHLLLVLGALLYIALTGTLAAWITGQRMSPPYIDGSAALIVVSALLAIVIFMYARRQLNAGRLILLGLPPVVMLLFVIAPLTALVHHAFPAKNTGDSLTLDDNPAELQQGQGAPVLVDHRNVLLQLPLVFHGTRAAQAAVAKGVQVTLTTEDGFRWSSPFQASQTALYTQKTAHLDVQIPLRIYQRLAGKPVNLQFHAAVTSYAPGPAATVVIPQTGNLALPDGGTCTQDPLRNFLSCRYALRHPAPAEMHFDVQDVPCARTAAKHDFPRYTLSSETNLQPDFDPVELQGIQFNTFKQDPDAATTASLQYLCPNAHASFAQERQLWQQVLTLSQTHFELDPYISKDLVLNSEAPANSSRSR